jgi:hypothetical protein
MNMQKTGSELQSRLSIKWGNSDEYSESLLIGYLLDNKYVGDAMAFFNRYSFRWVSFYPREKLNEPELKGIGTWAHTATMCEATKKFNLKPGLRVEKGHVVSLERQVHLEAMGICSDMKLEGYLSKSIDFSRKKFGFEFENPFA